MMYERGIRKPNERNANNNMRLNYGTQSRPSPEMVIAISTIFWAIETPCQTTKLEF